MLERPGRLYAMRSDCYWLDIGTPGKYFDAQLDVLAGAVGPRPTPTRRGACPGRVGGARRRPSIPAAALVAPVLVGHRARIAADVTLNRTVDRCRGRGAGRRPAAGRRRARRRRTVAAGSEPDASGAGCRRCPARDRRDGMKALITGGAGFIGSTLVDRLLAEDWSVDVADDLSSGNLGEPRRRPRRRRPPLLVPPHRHPQRGRHRPDREQQARRRVPPRRAGRRAGVGGEAAVRRRGEPRRPAQRVRGRAGGRRQQGGLRELGRHDLRHAHRDPDARDPPAASRVAVRRRQEGRWRLPALLQDDPRARLHRDRVLRTSTARARTRTARPAWSRSSPACSSHGSGRRSSATASRPATSSSSTTSSTRSPAPRRAARAS